MKLYVTYGSGSNLAGCYSVAYGEDYDECRRVAMLHTGGKFAFTYTEAEFEGQIERFGLSEVPLQPQVMER